MEDAALTGCERMVGGVGDDELTLLNKLDMGSIREDAVAVVAGAFEAFSFGGLEEEEEAAAGCLLLD